MRKLLSLVALVALAGCSLLHSPPAGAATSVITWANPTTNTDGSPIIATGDETSLASWRIEFGTCASGAFGTKAGEVVRAGAALTTATLNTQSGLKCFRVFVTNVAGVESNASNVASRTIAAPTPNAPTSATAN